MAGDSVNNTYTFQQTDDRVAMRRETIVVQNKVKFFYLIAINNI
jgi:hypothetical protein